MAEHVGHSYTKDRKVLLNRLRRLEGQVRGIARMVDREEYCVDILQQTAALRAAVDALGLLILEDHIRGCMKDAAERATPINPLRRCSTSCVAPWADRHAAQRQRAERATELQHNAS